MDVRGNAPIRGDYDRPAGRFCFVSHLVRGNAPIRGDYDSVSVLWGMLMPLVRGNAPIRGDYDAFDSTWESLSTESEEMPRSEGITTSISDQEGY